jgi:hypothetical protein
MEEIMKASFRHLQTRSYAMTTQTPFSALALSFLLSTCLSIPALTLAAEDSPLDPMHMTGPQKAYWVGTVAKMDPKGEDRVSREGFIKYYSDLWDKNTPPGKSAVSSQELTAKWAAMETQNPLDPEYKTAMWREKHVETMDTDHDGTVTKAEFLKHMEGHWEAATKLAQSQTLTRDQTIEMISNPLDTRYHKH